MHSPSLTRSLEFMCPRTELLCATNGAQKPKTFISGANSVSNISEMSPCNMFMFCMGNCAYVIISWIVSKTGDCVLLGRWSTYLEQPPCNYSGNRNSSCFKRHLKLYFCNFSVISSISYCADSEQSPVKHPRSGLLLTMLYNSLYVQLQLLAVWGSNPRQHYITCLSG